MAFRTEELGGSFWAWIELWAPSSEEYTICCIESRFFRVEFPSSAAGSSSVPAALIPGPRPPAGNNHSRLGGATPAFSRKFGTERAACANKHTGPHQAYGKSRILFGNFRRAQHVLGHARHRTQDEIGSERSLG